MGDLRVYWTEIDDMPGYEVSSEGEIRRIGRYREVRIRPGGVVRVMIGGKVLQRGLRKLVRTHHGG